MRLTCLHRLPVADRVPDLHAAISFFSIGGKLFFRNVKQGVDVYTHNY